MTTQPLTYEQKLAVTAGILKTGKSLAADRFPKPSPEITQAWAAALDGMFHKFPFPAMWREAVLHWSVEMVTEDMVTPKDIKAAVYAVRNRWERKPERRQALEAWREARGNSVVHELARGA